MTYTKKEILQEYRLFSDFKYDPFGACMEIWFNIAGHMYNRGLNIPTAWNYRPGLNPVETDNIYCDIFINTEDETLIELGNLFHRYYKMIETNKPEKMY